MASPTYSELLDAAKQAHYDVLVKGQEVVLNGRRCTRSDLPWIQNTIDWLEKKVAEQARGGVFSGMKTGVPYRA